MKEYVGNLVGGPEDGNSVSVSVPRIKTRTSTEMWVDGLDKPSVTVTQVGSYYWIERLRCFRWHAESIDFKQKRQLQAA